MRVARSPQFDAEAERFGLRFTCEECAHFDARRESCGHEWPVALHRRSRYQPPSPVEDVVFCKEFESA